MIGWLGEHVATLGAYLHRIDPFAIRFSEGLGLRWYGLSYLAGFAAAYLIIRGMAGRGRSPLPRARVADFIFTVALATVVGGRLGYCIFYDPSRFVEFTKTFPFWGVLAIHKGGMASHGGILGIAVGSLIFARRNGVRLTHLMDLCAFGGVIGVAFGRAANFVNGELIGKVASPSLPWAVKFPQAILEWPRRRPEKLPELAPVIESIRPEELGVIVDGATWRAATEPGGAATPDWVYAALSRVVDLVQRDDATGDRAAAMLEPFLEPRHPSQIYAGLLEGIAVFAALAVIWAVPRKPGVVGAWFLILYNGVRIVVDPFRIPDPAIEHELLGISRVQTLSILMMLAGAGYLLWSIRRATEKLGGWRRP